MKDLVLFVEAMSSPTAAAWIQAIGSLAAVGIAIWVSHQSERTSERNAEIASKHFIDMAEAAIGGLYVVSGSQSEEASVQTTRFIGELKEVQLIGQGVQLGQLPTSLCKHVLSARITVGHCVDLGAEFGKFPLICHDLQEGLQSHPRDGRTIANALLKASWESIKEVKEKCKES